MNKISGFIWLSILWVAFPCTPANAGSVDGMYVSFHTGITDVSKSSTLAMTSAEFGVDVDFSKGFNVGGAIGYQFNDNFRVEGEITYRNNSLSNVLHTNGKISETGELTQIGLMANILYDFDSFFLMGVGITPYFGGGLGFSGTDLDEFVGPSSSISLLTDNDDVSFAGQFIVGMGYELFNTALLTMDYRYLTSNDLQFKDLSADFKLENNSHNFVFGVRYYFW